MNAVDQQRYAVAKLVGYCEGVIMSGALRDEQELKLRALVANTLDQFGMPHHCQFTRDLEAVRAAMEEA